MRNESLPPSLLAALGPSADTIIGTGRSSLWFEGQRDYIQGAVIASQAVDVLALTSLGDVVKLSYLKFPRETICDGIFTLHRTVDIDMLPAEMASMVMSLDVGGRQYSALFLPDPSAPVLRREAQEFGQSLLRNATPISPYVGSALITGLSMSGHLFSALVAVNKEIHLKTIAGAKAIRLGFISGLRIVACREVIGRDIHVSVSGHEIKRDGQIVTSIAELKYDVAGRTEAAHMCFVFQADTNLR